MKVYPTRRAIGLAALGAPVALAVALAAPKLWSAAAAWLLMTAGLMLADLMLAAPPSRLKLSLTPFRGSWGSAGRRRPKASTPPSRAPLRVRSRSPSASTRA